METFILDQYPMGPACAKVLGVAHQKEIFVASITEDMTEEFSRVFLERLSEYHLNDVNELTDLIEELVGMAVPHLAVKVLMEFSQLVQKAEKTDFRLNFHSGNAYLLLNDILSAIDYFRRAQSIVPAETAPYVNLAKIYLYDHKDEEARKWCLLGLQQDANHAKLWEMLYTASESDPNCIDLLKKHVLKLNSWAGESLLYEILYPEEPDKKLTPMQAHYDRGERHPDFLLEFTALLGVCGQYDKIPNIIWQAEHLKQLQGSQSQSEDGTEKNLNWQLYAHEIQAFLALERLDQARDSLNKIKNNSHLSEKALGFIQEIEKEINL